MFLDLQENQCIKSANVKIEKAQIIITTNARSCKRLSGSNLNNLIEVYDYIGGGVGQLDVRIKNKQLYENLFLFSIFQKKVEN